MHKALSPRYGVLQPRALMGFRELVCTKLCPSSTAVSPHALVGLKEAVYTELCPSRQHGRNWVIYGGHSLTASGRRDPLSISQLQVFPAIYFCPCCLELWGQEPRHQL